MGLDVYFREDVLHALLAAEQASAATAATLGEAPNPAEVRAFRQGFRAALATLATAFGIEAVTISSEYRPAGDALPVILTQFSGEA